jgi:hypothetical protein
MKELVYSTNQIWKYQLPAVAQELKGAKIAYFDSFNLVSAFSEITLCLER